VEVKTIGEQHVAWNPSSRRLAYSRLSALFNWAIREHPEWACSNPTDKIRWPSAKSRGPASIPTPGEFEKLVQGVSPHIRDILILLDATGARPSEILRVTAADYYRDARVFVLHEHKTCGTLLKRIIHLPPIAIAIVERLVTEYPTGVLFRTRYKQAYTSSKEIGTTIRMARKRLGLPKGIVLYGLRHGFATDLLASGEPGLVVAALLGHKTTRVLEMNYAHINENVKLLKDALARTRGKVTGAE